MTFYSHVNKTHFHKKSFPLGAVLKTTYFGTHKWPITSKSASFVGQKKVIDVILTCEFDLLAID